MTRGQHLYVMQMGKTGAIKVGRSSNVETRKRQLQTGCPYEIRILLVAENQGHREKFLHREMRQFRLRGQRGEWFSEFAIGSIPVDLYDLMSEDTIEMVNGDWWKNVRDPRF